MWIGAGREKTLLLTPSPTLRGSYHLFPRRCTHTHTHSHTLTHTHTHTLCRQDLTTAATENQQKQSGLLVMLWVFKFGGKREGWDLQLPEVFSPVWTELLQKDVFCFVLFFLGTDRWVWQFVLPCGQGHMETSQLFCTAAFTTSGVFWSRDGSKVSLCCILCELKLGRLVSRGVWLGKHPCAIKLNITGFHPSSSR